MKPFKSNKALWWAICVLFVLGGVFVAAVYLPMNAEPYGGDAPDVQVPGMKNVPEGHDGPALELETRDE
jgi:hypothetical protein